GDHVIEWRYNKDSSVTVGTDVGWLSNIGLDNVLSAPLPAYSCNLIRQTEEPAPSIVTVTQSSGGGGGGGAMSGWFYLVFGLPLMMRRRFRKH
ncbi:MAG: hypothetical protein KAQ67_09940, partial [Gammaproteobacteria bacterium]|nr:hypothetical protein [Gammaproteobacteria bacterium]